MERRANMAVKVMMLTLACSGRVLAVECQLPGDIAKEKKREWQEWWFCVNNSGLV